MADDVRWGGERGVGDGTLELDFRVDRQGGSVPCVARAPSTRPPWPLVLLGHGAGGHKRNERMVGLGRWFSCHADIAALAIDGPYHGERVAAPLDAVEYQRRMLDDGLQTVVERMTGDWTTAIAALASLGIVDTGRLGYFGLSMGTRFGIHLGVALGRDLRCAVLGKFGLTAAPGFYGDADSTSIVADTAPAFTAPTMFHVQLDDELFPLDGQLRLFGLLGSEDKVLLARPGSHKDSSPTAPALWREFIASRI